MRAVSDVRALAPAARLLARLLLKELDAATLAELARPELAAALAELGLALPAETELAELGAEYCAAFLHPNDALPPIRSLWSEGRYDGDAAQAVRALARASGRVLAAGARGAPPDHLGCLLALWADLAEEEPEFAAQLAREHLAFAPRALAHLARRTGFYGALAAATGALVGLILADESARAER